MLYLMLQDADKAQENLKSMGNPLFIPIVDRCGMGISLQLARFAQAGLPTVRAQLRVPRLRLFFSPARVRRLMHVLRNSFPGPCYSLFFEIACCGPDITQVAMMLLCPAVMAVNLIRVQKNVASASWGMYP